MLVYKYKGAIAVLLITTVIPVDAATFLVGKAEELETALQQARNGDIIRLTSDITLVSPLPAIDFKGGAVTLDAAGRRLLEADRFAALAIASGQLVFANPNPADGIVLSSLNGQAGSALAIGAATVTTGSSNQAGNFGGVMSGDGGLTQTGSNFLTLSGRNTYTGLTTITAGAGIILGDDDSDGSVAGAILNDGKLFLANSQSDVFENAVSGQGALTNLNANRIISGANTYAGLTTVTGSTFLTAGAKGTLSPNSEVQITSSSAVLLNGLDQQVKAISGAGDIVLGTATLTLADSRAGSASFAGNISGAGALTVAGKGTQILTGQSSYTGTTTVGQGATLQFGDGGSTGGIAGGPANGILNNGTLRWHRNSPGTIDNPISGNGGIAVQSGDLTLTASNAFGAAIAVAQGARLAAGTAHALGDAGQVQLESNAVLDLGNFDHRFASLSGASGSSVMLGSASITVQDADSATVFAGTLVGTGGLRFLGAGSLTLAGDNLYTGLTSIAQGTLALGAGGTTGSVGGDIVVDGGTLSLHRSDRMVFTATTSGSGMLSQDGAGTTVLVGASTMAGTLRVSGGTLETAKAGVLSAASAVDVAAGATLDLNGFAQTIPGLSGAGLVKLGSAQLHNTAVAPRSRFDGAITGSGSYRQSGTGIQVLGGVNTYTGGTWIDAGAQLVVGDGGRSGSLGGAVDNSGTLVFARANASAFDGVIAGTGALFKQGGGTLQLGGANTYSGATRVLEGVLKAGRADAFSANSVLDLAAGATIDMNGFSVAVGALAGAGNIRFDKGVLTSGGAGQHLSYAGSLSGAGAFVQNGSGVQIFTGTHSYTGGTRIDVGAALVLGDGGDGGSIGGPVVNNGLLAFHRRQDVSYNDTISGQGRLAHMGPATLTLRANNDYRGGTDIYQQATLVVGNGERAGSIVGPVRNDGLLVFHRSDAVDQTALISGSGGVTQAGAGMLTLRGAQPYTGLTTVAAGALTIDQSIAGSLKVLQGATMIGRGQVGGDVAFDSGASFSSGVNADGTSPLLTVGGNVQIASGARAVLSLPGTYTPDAVYRFIAAAGQVSGTFVAPAFELAFLTPRWHYSEHAVNFTLDRNGTAFADVGQNHNQVAVGAMLSQVQASGGAAPALAQAINLTAIGNANDARQNFSSMAGSALASARGGQMVLAQTALALAMPDSGIALGTGLTDVAQSRVRMMHFRTRRGGDPNADGASGRGAALALGWKGETDARTEIGFALSHAHHAATPDQGGPDARDRATLLLAHAARAGENTLLRGAVFAGAMRGNAQRLVAVANDRFGQRWWAHANSEASFTGLTMEASAPAKADRWSPVLGLTTIVARHRQLSERGGDALGLLVQAGTTTSVRAALGLRGNFRPSTQGGLSIAPELFWIHEFGDAARPHIDARFAGAPQVATPMNIIAARTGRNGGAFRLRAQGALTPSLSLTAGAGVERSIGMTSQSIQAGLRYQW